MDVTKRVCNDPKKLSQPFEKLHDDILIVILSKLSSSSSCPSDFISSLFVCKRFKQLAMNPLVLSKACSEVFAIKAKNWCEFAHQFLKLCINAGCIEACYFLGMVRFYCLGNRSGGASLMTRAAIKSHAVALYSLSVIQFNGSGKTESDKNLRAGFKLCTRAAKLGHVGALCVLGHCLRDGKGVKQNMAKGRRILVQANICAMESMQQKINLSSLSSIVRTCNRDQQYEELDISKLKPHPINLFLVEWFESKEMGPRLRLCSYPRCGRPETRSEEFTRCSGCRIAKYCSRFCQALDWKLRHKVQCTSNIAHQVG